MSDDPQDPETNPVSSFFESATRVAISITKFLQSLQGLAIAVTALIAIMGSSFYLGGINPGQAQLTENRDAEGTDGAEPVDEGSTANPIGPDSSLNGARSDQDGSTSLADRDSGGSPGSSQTVGRAFRQVWTNQSIGVPNGLRGVRYGRQVDGTQTMIYVDGASSEACQISVVDAGDQTQFASVSLSVSGAPVVVEADTGIEIALTSVRRRAPSFWKHCFFNVGVEERP